MRGAQNLQGAVFSYISLEERVPAKHPLSMGSYFGRWCIEAVAAVKAFGLDDSLCLGHEHYPGDLLRPDGPSTHPVRQEAKGGLLARLFGKKG